MNDKNIRQKERFDIEIEKEELNPNQAANQLKNWCKLFECLSKRDKQPIESLRKNKKAICAFGGSIPKKSLNGGRFFRLRTI